MAIQERRERQRAERHQRIVEAARAIAEAEGWAAVTTRRLAERIEYSQPVLYGHFPGGKEAISSAVALQGFGELADRLGAGVAAAPDPAAGLVAMAEAYLRFAEENAAVYEAMFTMPSELTFAAPETPPALQAGFQVLRDTLGAATGETDLAVRTELAWSTLHGLATLTAARRVRPEDARTRLDLLVAQWQATHT
ncbi:TetR/AcrR family transcriptional regulator [Pseudonocardia sp. TRM90224]|uniref:TetR/AcrR family transcriptional regulator n=1 Tax=Pseudonocardia sp. TRM90224 TaxID=2812678 RepID=UPI001E3E2F0E|nr:TetR-like C-terminal domain-containing protein [Pseudonocardia sp. TRM90224]